MRVQLKGLHTVKRKLADGSTRVHYYAWRGGPKIDAEPDTEAFVLAYTKAHENKPKPADISPTIKGLITEFKGSTAYTDLSAASQRAYTAYLKLIATEFGTLPLVAAEDPKARGDFMVWRDGMATKRRTADYAWSVLARLLSFAKDRGRITNNVCERGGRLYKANRAECIWEAEHITRFMAVASFELQLALVLALWTGQRQGDLIRLGWTRYDGTHIRLKQSKTGARVTIPAGETLRAALATAPRRATTILTNQDGQPWTSDGFRTSWRKACEKAEVAGLTFHDLRGTAVTRLAIAGCEVPEICAITGHYAADASRILDVHYLGRDVRLAESAMRKREEKESGTGR